MKVTHVSYLRGLRRRLRKKQSEFTAHHDFISDGDLQLSQEELADAVELNRVISIMLNGQLMFPAFQFDSQGHVYELLQEHLPRLLNSGRSGWDICFWLFTEQAVTLKRAVPSAAILKRVSYEEMLELGKQAAETTGSR